MTDLNAQLRLITELANGQESVEQNDNGTIEEVEDAAEEDY
mgnify:CR=1 FL=1